MKSKKNAKRKTRNHIHDAESKPEAKIAPGSTYSIDSTMADIYLLREKKCFRPVFLVDTVTGMVIHVSLSKMEPKRPNFASIVEKHFAREQESLLPRKLYMDRGEVK